MIGRAHGRRTAPATELGNVTGSYVLVVAVALGVGSLVECFLSTSYPSRPGPSRTRCGGLGTSAARTWFAGSDRRLSMIGGAGGFAMIGLGVTVAATGRTD